MLSKVEGHVLLVSRTTQFQTLTSTCIFSLKSLAPRSLFQVSLHGLRNPHSLVQVGA